MTDIILKTGSRDSIIHCGSGAFESNAPKLKERQLFIVTDKNVYSLYKDLIKETFGNAPVKVLPAGEAHKTPRSLLSILTAMADAGMKRSCTVIAFGGGVIGDVAGLAASLYMRGVNLVQIPTTLLSQVDSSVGGKTAVDLKGIKNLVGTFYQPEEVIADPLFLQTLPAREIRCGLGEIIKHGALDGAIFDKLLNADNLFDLKFLGGIIADNINCKAKVVAADEKEKGLRKILNLGHTTGHAFELYYKRKSHGEFVLIGMYYEIFIAKALGIGDTAYYGELIKLIKRVINKIPAYDNIEDAAKMAVYDKKNREGAKISLIAPLHRGGYEELNLEADEYVRLVRDCRDSLKGVK